jgi:hypothetical protein
MKSALVLNRYYRLYDDLYLASSKKSLSCYKHVFEIFLPEYFTLHLRLFDGTNSLEQGVSLGRICRSLTSYIIRPFISQKISGQYFLGKAVIISPAYLKDDLIRTLSQSNICQFDNYTLITTHADNVIRIKSKCSQPTKPFYREPRRILLSIIEFISSDSNRRSLSILDEFIYETYRDKYLAHKVLSRAYFLSRLISLKLSHIDDLSFDQSSECQLISCDPASPLTRALAIKLSGAQLYRVTIAEIGQIFPDSIPHEYVFNSHITESTTYLSSTLKLPYNTHVIQQRLASSSVLESHHRLSASRLLKLTFASGTILFLGTNLSNSRSKLALHMNLKYLAILYRLFICSKRSSIHIYLKPHPLASRFGRNIFRLTASLSSRIRYIDHKTSLEAFLSESPIITTVISCNSTGAKHYKLHGSRQYYY